MIAIFSISINTKSDLRVMVVVMWIIVWTVVIYYDYPYEIDKVLSITFVRVLMLIINIFYVIESAIYVKKRIPVKKSNKHAP